MGEKTKDSGPNKRAGEWRVAIGVHAGNGETVLCQIKAGGGGGLQGMSPCKGFTTSYLRCAGGTIPSLCFTS